MVLYYSIVIIVVVSNSFGRRCYEFHMMLHKRFQPDKSYKEKR